MVGLVGDVFSGSSIVGRSVHRSISDAKHGVINRHASVSTNTGGLWGSLVILIPKHAVEVSRVIPECIVYAFLVASGARWSGYRWGRNSYLRGKRVPVAGILGLEMRGVGGCGIGM